MLRLLKTVLRWYSTVAGLMNRCADLQVVEAFAVPPGDLGLLGGEVLARLDGARSGAFASRQELALRPLGERLHTHPDEHLVGGGELVAGVEAPALATQLLADQQMGAAQLGAHASAECG